MATVTFRGKAALEGIVGSFDVIIYPMQQSAKITQNFEEEIVKDNHGFDTAWLGRNENHTSDWGMKLLGDTAAHAAAGGVFLGPLTVVTLSGFTLSSLNTTWQVMPGSDIDLGNTKVGDITFKLRRYADATQNALAGSTPS